MLPQSARLREHKDIQNVLRKGKRLDFSHLTLKYFKGGVGVKRATVVVSTKVAKKANKRNLLKRIVRESLKFFWQQIPTGDWLFIVKPSAVLLDRKSWRKEVDTYILKSITLVNSLTAPHPRPSFRPKRPMGGRAGFQKTLSYNQKTQERQADESN